MTERFVTNAGTIAVANGASTVIGTGTLFGGRDREGAKVYACPAAAAPFPIGTVAAVEPRGIYENLELPLVSPYNGATLTDIAYELVDGPAIANGATQAAIYARFAAFLEENMGLVGNTADDIDYSLIPNNSLFVDDVTRTISRWRNGILELVFAIGLDSAPRGPWVGAPLSKFALTIATGDVAVNFDDGLLDSVGRAHFQLTFDASFELLLPTNVEVDEVYDILFIADGGGDTPSFATGFAGTEATAIRTLDGERTRLRFTVTAETGGTATAVAVALVTFAENDLIEDGGFNFVSNVADNSQEPQLDTGDPVSDDYWTWKPAPAGVAGVSGSSDVVGSSASSVAIATGSKAFTVVEADRGWGIGARLRLSSDAGPSSDWMEGVVTAYSGTSLTVLVDRISGSGSHADWTINLAGEPSPAAPSVREVTTAGDITVLASDDIILVNKASGAATNVNLGLAADRLGRPLIIKDKKRDADVNNITPVASGGELIDGVAPAAWVINTPGGGLKILPVTGGWETIL